jgi:DNA polymerase-3 subunit epsilon
MPSAILFGPDGVSFSNSPAVRIERKNKGKSLIAFPEDFTVIDLETTGFDPHLDNIIEVAALRIRGGEIVDSLTTLVKPYDEIDEFITQLTGITNDMLSTAPTPEEIFPSVREFIGEDIIVGHNVNFDVNFLYDWFDIILKVPLTNNYIDTMRISRKALPELKHHRLKDIAAALEVSPSGAHRALSDCHTTFECLLALRDRVSALGDIEEFIRSFKYHSKEHHAKKLDLREITAENATFDETHLLFGKHCVFTGALERMTRAEAAQIVVNVGGICDNTITKKTNFLILGNNDYCKTIKDGKSSKQKKAEEYKLGGIDIEIIPENVFYDMLED